MKSLLVLSLALVSNIAKADASLSCLSFSVSNKLIVAVYDQTAEKGMRVLSAIEANGSELQAIALKACQASLAKTGDCVAANKDAYEGGENDGYGKSPTVKIEYRGRDSLTDAYYSNVQACKINQARAAIDSAEDAIEEREDELSAKARAEYYERDASNPFPTGADKL